MIDPALILRKLAELDTLSSQIEEYRGISADDYRSDWKTQRIVERTLHLMIELCVDVANHIISEKALPVPTSYAHAFEILNQAGLLDDELAGKLVRMAKFRNILVHQYTVIDAAIVAAILRDSLSDFVRFRDAIIVVVKQG